MGQVWTDRAYSVETRRRELAMAIARKRAELLALYARLRVADDIEQSSRDAASCAAHMIVAADELACLYEHRALIEAEPKLRLAL